MTQLPPHIEWRLERLCAKGCRAVWEDIARLERGETLPETADLPPGDAERLLRELQAVMAVYAGRCLPDPPSP